MCLLLVKWCWCCFRTSMGPSLGTTRIVDRWLIVYSIMPCLKRGWNLLFTLNADECWQMELFMLSSGLWYHMDLWNISILPQHYMVLQSTSPRLESLLWKPQILQMELFCIMTMLNLICSSNHWNNSKTEIQASPTQHTVHILPHPITIFLGHS